MSNSKSQMYVVMFLFVLLFVFPSCTKQQNQPNSLLLFSQQTEEVLKIYSVYPDGSNVKHITDLPVYSQYWLSPDGTQLAYLAGDKLSVVDILTGKVFAEIENARITVSEHFLEKVAWSPKGDKFVYVSNSSEKQGTDIWLYDLTTGENLPLTYDEAVDLEPVWSTAGQYIAFVNHKVCDESIWDCPPEQKYWDIATINIDTSERKTISDFKGSGLLPPNNMEYASLCNLLWSPDDNYITFENACNRSGLQWWKQVFVAPTDGSDLFQLTHFSEYNPNATQFPVSLFLYSKLWAPSDNTLFISYTEAELVEGGNRNDGFFLVPENEFSNTEVQIESNILGKSAYWAPNKEYVIGNPTSVLGFPMERPFIGKFNANKIDILNSSEPLPYGSCHGDSVQWSPNSQYVAYVAEQDNTCSHTPMQNQDIVMVTISDTNVTSEVIISNNSNNQPIGWLSLD